MERVQRLFAVRRNGRFYGSYKSRTWWCSSIEDACIWPEKQARSKARIDVGMPCELVEVQPVIRPYGEVTDV